MHRLLLTSYFLAVSCYLTAQPFFLFNDFTAKEFAPLTETWERNYSIKMDSLYWGDVISVFYLHSVMNLSEDANFEPGENDPEECFGWGGCFANSGSTGFGSMIFSPVPFAYEFYTLGGDTLRLDFFSDSSAFYQNDEEFFALIFEGESEQMVVGSQEMVQSYRIGHYTTDGDAMDSPLHGSAVTVGETTGLIDFFQVDEFPAVEMPLTLIGDAGHDQSLTVITSEVIYDFEVGDTIQYKISYSESEPGNPDFTEEISYLIRIFLSRADEIDSLRYTVLHQSFEQGEIDMMEWTEELVFYRFDTLGTFPFYQRKSATDGQVGSYQEQLFSRLFCGETLIGLRGVSAPFYKCENHAAWCGFDTNGPPAITTYEFVPGLGQYVHEVARNGFGTFDSWRQATEIVYFSKSGDSCGQEAILSVGNQERPSLKLTVYPNPTQGLLNVRLASKERVQLSALEVLDMSGRTVATYPWQELEMRSLSAVDISGLTSGIYLLQVTSVNGVIGVKRFVVE